MEGMRTIKKILAAVCILYTVITLASALWGLCSRQAVGAEVIEYHAHQLLRFVICLIGVGSAGGLAYAWHCEHNWGLTLHYFITLLGVLLLVWACSWFLPLAKYAYRDVIWNYSLFYSLCVAANYIRIWNKR
ncbi:hypothetical protein B9T62_04870 [Paenibacillus donghaensis]|uniref:Uncharacterized protein n=2 Tax=Paenibacillus donghaensis TaxID=414771 RepID=A0A2Z2KDW7_9BACL|nr:hypothetical protein B9T62_04870 [Paenibacillus donghaensis]